MSRSTEKPASLAFLIDTNVILDVVLDRHPWASDAAILFDLIVRGKARGYVASHSITTIAYLVQRTAGRVAAATSIADLLGILAVVPLDAADFQRALAMGLNDYEDAVQVAASLKVGATAVVTRNSRDYVGGPAKCLSAGEAVALVDGMGKQPVTK